MRPSSVALSSLLADSALSDGLPVLELDPAVDETAFPASALRDVSRALLLWLLVTRRDMLSEP